MTILSQIADIAVSSTEETQGNTLMEEIRRSTDETVFYECPWSKKTHVYLKGYCQEKAGFIWLPATVNSECTSIDVRGKSPTGTLVSRFFIVMVGGVTRMESSARLVY